ncbi:MAG: DinB family protein [Tepidiformaceae bacterium]
MARSLLEDAFTHHAWATVRLIEACGALTFEQLAIAPPATFGSILDTLRHIVRGDTFFLRMLKGRPDTQVDTSGWDLRQLRAAIESNAAEWSALLRENPDPDAVVRDVDDEGWVRDAPVGMRLAQALHHAGDHRSQVCTALTTLGIDPPSISAMDYGLETGQVAEVYPP